MSDQSLGLPEDLAPPIAFAPVMAPVRGGAAFLLTSDQSPDLPEDLSGLRSDWLWALVVACTPKPGEPSCRHQSPF